MIFSRVYLIEDVRRENRVRRRAVCLLCQIKGSFRLSEFDKAFRSTQKDWCTLERQNTRRESIHSTDSGC